MASTPPLFRPLKVGSCNLQHRVAMAPLTRFRAHDDHTPSELAREYYEQRASVPGTLLITEATFVSAGAGGFKNVPGIYTDLHVAAWRRIADSVHRHGSFIFLQLWHLGRAAQADILTSDPGGPFDVVSASDIPLEGKRATKPRSLTLDEIKQTIHAYAEAAFRAVEGAGTDGVEIHGANGYLIDQFLQAPSNRRTDIYGGSIANRVRFALEVVQAVSERVGQERVGIRLSPYSRFQGMGESDPRPLFSHYVSKLRDRFPHLAYIHVVEPRYDGDRETEERADASVGWLREIWQQGSKERVFLRAGGYTTREKALEVAETGASTVAVFGRLFISNPDLPRRLTTPEAPLELYDRKTFYTRGPTASRGYTDYPFLGVGRSGDSKL